jgi:hypothetical protein
MRMTWVRAAIWVVCAGCEAGSVGDPEGETTGAVGSSSTSGTTGSASTSTGSSSSEDATTDDPSSSSSESGSESTTDDPPSACAAADVDAPFVACDRNAKGGSLTPVVEWERRGQKGRFSTMPLVINLTDDNGDGSVDLCDTPDVIAVYCDSLDYGEMLVLDGATGEEHWTARVRCNTNPAAGDVDGDGDPEIFTYDETSRAVLLSGTGEVEEQSHESKFFGGVLSRKSSISDLDNDGDVEIVNGHLVFDHTLDVVEVLPDLTGMFHTLADLDGDDDVEIIYRNEAYHHDGELAWSITEPVEWIYDGGVVPSAVLQADDDEDPEIAFGMEQGLWIREHDGADKLFIPFETSTNFGRPVPLVANLDGDAASEILLATRTGVIAHDVEGTLLWSWDEEPTDQQSRLAAFDFLGQGRAQVVLANSVRWAALDEGQAVAGSAWTETGGFSVLRGPTIADIDNDGSAEILIAEFASGGALRAYGAEDGSWVAARRIWNQADYHVTNVAEDGTIPVVEPRWWTTHNTFFTQAQITADGEVCAPR